jgi:protein-disulfide isomerase
MKTSGKLILAALLALSGCSAAPPPVAAPEVTIAAPVVEKTLSDEPPGPDAGPIPVTAADPTSGSADAPVTLVQIGDFGNPFCAEIAPWIRALRERYPLDRLRIVYKSVPDADRPESLAAAITGLSVFVGAGPTAFWSYHQEVFAAYPDLAPAKLDQIALRAGITPEALHRLQASASVGRALMVNQALARKLDVTTPQVLVNGIVVLSLSSSDALQAAIEAELLRADELIAAGTPPGKVYAARATDNLEKKAGRAQPKQPSPEPAARVLFGAKHILVMYQGARRSSAGVTRTKAEALTLARSIAKKARAGQPFEDLVTKYSDEPRAAERGGDLGKFPGNVMVPEFQTGLEATPVGKISDVVETPFGYHVILRTQ